jgi:metallo-beta-lactamase family protein
MNHNPSLLQFFGAAGTVTGSRTRVQSRTSNVLIDCGLYQGPKELRQKNRQELLGLKGLHAAILTHAHIDHSGLIPLLPQNGFQGPIYSSAATAELCRILLPDSAKLQEEDARFLNQKHLTHFEPAKPLYSFDDVEKALRQLQVIPDNHWVPISNDFSFRFQRAGHILGARMIEVNVEGQRLLFSGDLGPLTPLILKEPYQPSEVDYLILESTYGDRCHEKGDRKAQLAKIINQVIGRGGTLLIPAFAVGRTQEILFLLSQLEKENAIGKVPVYLDSPMALDATEVYTKFEDELRPEISSGLFTSPLRSSQFKTVRDPDESMLLCMDSSPKIVISAAGMLTGGRILHHLRMKLPDPNSGVLFVGYQVPGTKGYLLKNGLSSIRIHKQEVDVEAEIFSMDSMSAHADHDDLVSWCRSFRSKPKMTYLNHGADSSREALAYSLRNELGWNVHLPAENEAIPFNPSL